MISADEEDFIFRHASVPEHTVSLMVAISGAEPFLDGEYLLYRTDEWVILVGYPLAAPFSEEAVADFFNQRGDRYRSRCWRIIAPALPSSILEKSRLREDDAYYTVGVDTFRPRGRLHREAEQAARQLRIGREKRVGNEHLDMIEAFVEDRNVTGTIRDLYLNIPRLLDDSPTSLLLAARTMNDELSALYVVDWGAKDFLTYVLGCRSPNHPVRHASDLLFLEMVRLAREQEKRYIHLGLGVNDGIRRFKTKWGGAPTLAYRYCEIVTGPAPLLSTVDTLHSRLW